MTSALRPGDPRQLGGYELLSRLGEGGMGTVFLGQASEDDQLVAIKASSPSTRPRTSSAPVSAAR